MILFILPNLCGGGAQRATVNLVNSLSRRGVECCVVLLLDREEVYSLNEGVVIIRLRASSFKASVLPLCGVLRRLKYQFVYAAMWHVNLLSTLSLLMVFRSPRRFLISSLHNNPELIRRTEGSPFIVDTYYKWVLRLSKRVICVDRGIADSVVSKYGGDPAQMRSVSNIIFTKELLHDIASSRSEMVRNGISRSASILWVGRFCYQKNLDLLVEIVLNSNYRFTIIGEGDDCFKLDPIRDLDRVNVLPFQEDIWRFYLSSSVLLLTSRFEGQGMVLAEAMQCGCFPISFDCDFGPRNVLVPPFAGCLVQEASASAFLSVIQQYLEAFKSGEADAYFDAMSVRAGAFSEEELVGRYLSFLDQGQV